jgi:hypothetical protein
MSHGLRNLTCDRVIARDGTVGSVNDLYFDDLHWTVRFWVVDACDWLPGQRVLIAPAAFETQERHGALQVGLTRQQILSTGGGGEEPEGPGRLHSGADLIGYAVEARDGAMGKVADLVVDPELSAIEGVLVDARDRTPPWPLLFSGSRVARLDHDRRRLRLGLGRDELVHATAPSRRSEPPAQARGAVASGSQRSRNERTRS